MVRVWNNARFQRVEDLNGGESQKTHECTSGAYKQIDYRNDKIIRSTSLYGDIAKVGSGWAGDCHC